MNLDYDGATVLGYHDDAGAWNPWATAELDGSDLIYWTFSEEEYVAEEGGDYPEWDGLYVGYGYEGAATLDGGGGDTDVDDTDVVDTDVVVDTDTDV